MPSKTAVRETLSNRQFALLWGGQTVSQFGDGVMSVALPLLVLTMTKSAADLGIVVAARLVPTVVFLLLGGAVSDRVSRRLAMLTSDVSRAAISATLGALGIAGLLNLTELLVGVILFGTFDALFYPASTAMLPEIVATDHLMSANSLSRFSGALGGGLLGPMAGGVIASTMSPSWSLVIDAGTFVVSASCLLAMKSTPTPVRSRNSMISDVKEGLTYCRATPWILWSIVVAGLANALVFSPSAVLLPLLFKRSLHAANWMVGLGFSMIGLGGMVGTLLMLVFPRPRRRVRTMLLVWCAGSLLAVPFGLAPSAWVALVIVFLVGVMLMVGNILWESLIQAEVPREILGRVSSVDWMVSLGLTPIGVASAGLVSGIVGVRPTIVVPGLFVGLVGISVVVLLRSVTLIDHPTAHTGD